MPKEIIKFVAMGKWPSSDPGVFSLVEDQWDDYRFKTLFTLYYTDEAREMHELGYVKIAKIGVEEGAPHTELPSSFTELSDEHYSLGQDREYYEKLMNLPDNLGVRVLAALVDVAYDDSQLTRVDHEEAFNKSLLRQVSELNIRQQFRNIIEGRAALTPYGFVYSRVSTNPLASELRLEFNVTPESSPPTNLHVLIGANGVGKSTMLNDLALAAAGNESIGALENTCNINSSYGDNLDIFANIVHVGYSAFEREKSSKIDGATVVHNVGLLSAEEGDISESLLIQFKKSVKECLQRPRLKRWKEAIMALTEADPLLHGYSLDSLFDQRASVLDEWVTLFSSLSSGHKIVLLTVTRIVELVDEKSLVLIDEPETHLHPPLLSAMIRAVSSLVIDRNGVAIIATHSPVVLQEVPGSCVWKLTRHGEIAKGERPSIESFGESVSRLTAETFGLDISKTGYHTILKKLLQSHGSPESVAEALENQLGLEGRVLLQTLSSRSRDEGLNDQD